MSIAEETSGCLSTESAPDLLRPLTWIRTALTLMRCPIDLTGEF